MKEEWEVKKLGEVCELITKGTTPTSLGYKFTSEGVNFIKVESLTETGEIIPEKVAFISDKCHQALKRSQLKTDDILFSIAGALGRIGVVNESILPANTNQALAIIRTRKNEDVTVNFLSKYFISQSTTEQIEKFRGGVAQQNLSLGQLNDLLIPIPPLPEQKRIVAILDEAFAAIAKAKENTEKNLQSAKELFQSELNSIFRTKSEGWENKRLNEISENLDSKRIPITKNVRNNGEYPYYGASGIVDYVNEYIFDSDLLLVSEDGANLLTRTYPIAFSISGKTWVNNHAHVLKFKNPSSQKFVEYYLNSIKLNPYVSGMAQPKLNQAMLNKIPIPFPSIDAQKKIVHNLDNLSTAIKKLEALYQQKLNDLEELKKSILEKAFAGELNVGISVKKAVESPKSISGISTTDLQAGLTVIALQKHIEKGKENTFHHVKAEKIINTVQYHLNIELDRSPVKDAAGPNDFVHVKNKVEPRAAKAGFYTVTKKEEGYYNYSLGRQANKLAEKTKVCLSEDLNTVDWLINLMVPMTTEQAEVLATVYAAWNNLLIDRLPIDDEAIVYEARENWHEKKLDIPREKFFNAIVWMKSQNLVPKGTGKKILSKLPIKGKK